MRYRIIYSIVVLIITAVGGSAQQPSETPDDLATATQLIAEATQTAAAQPTNTDTVEAIDEFALTATELVRQVTQTAAASGVENLQVTQDNSVFEVADDDFVLTATQLVLEVTQTAQVSERAGEPAPPTSNNAGGCAPAIIMPMGVVLFAFSWSRRGKAA